MFSLIFSITSDNTQKCPQEQTGKVWLFILVLQSHYFEILQGGLIKLIHSFIGFQAAAKNVQYVLLEID